MSSDDLKTPLYIADKNDFKRNITDFVAAFRKYYPNYNIGYSFKTNYCKEFINVVKRNWWICRSCFSQRVSACTELWI